LTAHCAVGASATWTTIRKLPAQDRRGCDGRPQALRRGRSFLLVVRRQQRLNALYYDYAIASAFTPGRFFAYPLPGRSYLLKAGVTF
jgi:hypothetical protein